MKKLLGFAAIAACACGCVMVGPTNAQSALTLSIGSPDTRFIDTSVKPAKCGVAKAEGVILFVEGDASIKAAMAQGGITKIHHVDYRVKNILGLFGSTETLVYGE